MKKMTLCLLVAFFLSLTLEVFAQPGGGQGRGNRDGGNRQGGPQQGGPQVRGGLPPGGGFMGMGNGILFQNEILRTELGITEEQSTKVREIFSTRPEGMQFPGQDATQEQREEFRRKFEAFATEQRDKVNAVLTPEQQAKAPKLLFQAFGGFDGPALNAQTMEVLKLTDDQKKKLEEIATERREEMVRRLPQGGDRPSPEEMQAQREASRTKYKEKTLAILTAAQKAEGEKLTAEGKDLFEKIRSTMPQPRGGEPRDRGTDQDRQRQRRGGEGRTISNSFTPGDGTSTNSDEAKPFPVAE